MIYLWIDLGFESGVVRDGCFFNEVEDLDLFIVVVVFWNGWFRYGYWRWVCYFILGWFKFFVFVVVFWLKECFF